VLASDYSVILGAFAAARDKHETEFHSQVEYANREASSMCDNVHSTLLGVYETLESHTGHQHGTTGSTVTSNRLFWSWSALHHSFNYKKKSVTGKSIHLVLLIAND
jgi:hypothetical protein